MAKNSGNIRSFEKIMADGKPKALYQCPCNPACKCSMQDPCLGCGNYGEWLNKHKEQG